MYCVQLFLNAQVVSDAINTLNIAFHSQFTDNIVAEFLEVETTNKQFLAVTEVISFCVPLLDRPADHLFCS
jgi:hypothetical protein